MKCFLWISDWYVHIQVEKKIIIYQRTVEVLLQSLIQTKIKTQMSSTLGGFPYNQMLTADSAFTLLADTAGPHGNRAKYVIL